MKDFTVTEDMISGAANALGAATREQIIAAIEGAERARRHALFNDDSVAADRRRWITVSTGARCKKCGYRDEVPQRRRADKKPTDFVEVVDDIYK